MPQPLRPRALLLDLDGTLLDTAPDLIGALNAVRLEQDLEPLAPEQLRCVVSDGSAAMIHRGFNLEPDDPRFEPLRLRFLDHYRDRVSQDTRPFDGIDALLERVEAAGMPWGIVTNKPGWLAEPLLQDLGYAARAACVIPGDALPVRKPDPAPILLACEQLDMHPEHCLMLGDAARDVEAGLSAGVPTLIALFGYIRAEDRPGRWGGHGMIGHPREVLPWLGLSDD